MKKSHGNDVIGFYEKNASKYDTERFSNKEGIFIDKIQKNIIYSFGNSFANKSILDLGCGTGRFSIELAHSKANVTSFDASFSMLIQLKDKIRDQNLDINFVKGNGYQLPFKDDTFDGCICINVLDHIADQTCLIKEISRILKKDGFLIINFSNLFSIYLPIALYINLRKKSVQNEVYAEWISIMKMNDIFKQTFLELSSVKGQLLLPNNPKLDSIKDLLKKLNIFFIDSPLRFASGSIFVMGLKK